MPKRVDHEVRRREITDAVVRITVKGGLDAATFREVAAEAGVSVRLIQYYFGTKDQLLLRTQQHVAQRAAERFRRHIAAAPDTPRGVLRAVLRSFIPVDDESREAMLMFVALHTAALLDPTLARPEAAAVPRALGRIVAEQLKRAKRRSGVDVANESTLIVAMIASLAQGVLDGMYSANEAFSVIDYALDRALR
jgi:TetR/AcrR family transcriptional regulator, transcriptional repressor of bet genes